MRVLRETARCATAISNTPMACIRTNTCRFRWPCVTTSTRACSASGLSRLLRENPEIRAMVPELSIVAPATGGLPVAYGVCEALRAKQVYWAEREAKTSPCASANFWSSIPASRWSLVDDILRSGSKLREMKTLLESRGAQVLASP